VTIEELMAWYFGTVLAMVVLAYVLNG